MLLQCRRTLAMAMGTQPIGFLPRILNQAFCSLRLGHEVLVADPQSVGHWHGARKLPRFMTQATAIPEEALGRGRK